MQRVCKGCYFAPRDLPASHQTTGRGNIEEKQTGTMHCEALESKC